MENKVEVRPERARFVRESADFRRQALIEATARCLAEKGVGGTSVRAICAYAGVSAGLLTHYFDGVDALILATYRDVGEKVAAAMERAVAEAGPDPRDRLWAYLRSNFQVQQYIPLGTRFTLGLNGELGLGNGLGDRPFPIFKNFFGGGLGSVRAFEQNSLGVVDPTGAYIGGAKRLNVNAELYVPVPGTGNDKSLRVFGFIDAGNVWREGEPIRADDLRSSIGVGLSWISPVGPLKLSWGKPLRSQPTDRIQPFQFQIGTAF